MAGRTGKTGEDWQFWVDVGGTFTDCLARLPDGQLRAHKLLSVARYRGAVALSPPDRLRKRPDLPESASPPFLLNIAGLEDAPPRFFQGFRVWMHGQPTGVQVVDFDSISGRLTLSDPLPAQREPPPEGTIIELAANEEAPVVGVRWLLGIGANDPIGPVHIKLGTTRGTNALLERQGARTALLITRGFHDLLEIGTQDRPKLFELEIRKASVLYHEVVEIEERIDAAGQVLRPIDLATAERDLRRLREAENINSLAICLLHSYRNPIHEEALARLAESIGFEHLSVSNRLAPLERIVPRADTTVVDAYLSPILRGYLARIAERMPQARIEVMTSAGALADAPSFSGRDSILSGPAGGVVAVRDVLELAEMGQGIGFDMGGTSTDVCRFAGDYERRYEMRLEHEPSRTAVRIVAPMLAIETVAAGGGSICDFDGQKPVVGPNSAGSDPGPACYGRGGPLTITDVNLTLGRLLPNRFAFPIDESAADQRLEAMAKRIEESTGVAYRPEDLALGYVRIANANVAAAIRRISLMRGYDPRAHALVSFGGAGGQHATAIARSLGIRTVLQHPLAGLLSAYGIGMADLTRFAAVAIGQTWKKASWASMAAERERLESQLEEELLRAGAPRETWLPPRRFLEMRYLGQDASLLIEEPDDEAFDRSFHNEHERLFGFCFSEREVEIRALRIERTARQASRKAPPSAAGVQPKPREATPAERTKTYWEEGWRETCVFDRESLQPGDFFLGPAIVTERGSTVLVESGWRGELDANGLLRLVDDSCPSADAERGGEALTKPSAPNGSKERWESADPIELELFNNSFAAIAQWMGTTLQKTALSTNVKERLDFSCALFTGQGELVVNAPHIPVHLGAMGETVRGVLASGHAIAPGDVWVTNDPYAGGSHLPDVTVLTPIFDEAGSAIRFWVGSRAHHAEIGGITPGSMPPFSTSLAEEGVLIPVMKLVEQGRFLEERIRAILERGPYPSRAAEMNLADLRAQVAANATGVQHLGQLIGRQGWPKVAAYMRFIQQAAEFAMRSALARFRQGRFSFEDVLDDGSRIICTIEVQHGEHGGTAIVDFAGTDPPNRGNWNANPAIVRSAVLYVFRCLIGEEIPLNDGVLAPVTVRVPSPSLLAPPWREDPEERAAVVGGNVETSQRIVDCLLGALGIAAASQGTMNNFLFGRSAGPGRTGFGYYETIGGGAGAGPGFHGASGVHTHMTNTRITDPEVLEARYPVRLECFAVRSGSGGLGAFMGGEGLVRELTFLEPVEVSLLTNRRLTRPYGTEGGEAGQPGRNRLLRAATGDWEELAPAESFQVASGDRLRIETPGGGGFGNAAAIGPVDEISRDVDQGLVDGSN